MFYLCIYLFGLFGTGFFKPIHLGSVISCQWLQPRDILVKCICLIYFLKNAFFEQKSNQNQLRLKKKKKEKNRTVTVIPSPGFPRAVWLPSLPPCRCCCRCCAGCLTGISSSGAARLSDGNVGYPDKQSSLLQCLPSFLGQG